MGSSFKLVVGPQELHSYLAFARFYFSFSQEQGLVELGRLTRIHLLPWEG